MGRLQMHEVVWLWYAGLVCAFVAVGGACDVGSSYSAGGFVLLHVSIVAFAVMVPLLLRSRPARRTARAVIVLVGLPTVFMAMGDVLPGCHPEPFEWVWIDWDRRLCGGDPTVMLQPWIGPLLADVLQCAYVSFYLVPVVAVLAVWRCRGADFDRALGVIQFGFLLSYLGYFFWPTLPPSRFLEHGQPITGLFVAEWLQAGVEAVEVHRWNCFPSGHTMMSVMSLLVVLRRPVVFWCLLPLVLLIVSSTVALRYHYLVDVIAGLVLVAPTYAFASWLYRDPLDRVADPR